MKFIFTIFLCFNFAVVFSQENKKSFNELNSYYHQKQFFKLKSSLKNDKHILSKTQKEFFNSVTLSVFNKPAESNSFIDELLSEDNTELTDSMKMDLLESKLLNCVNLYLYEEAYLVTDKLLNGFRKYIEKEDIEDFENSAIIWKAAGMVNPQTVNMTGDTRLDIKKDMAGLTNVKVSINNFEEEFIFDTGANFSTMSKSFAEKLGLHFLQGSVEVGAATGLKVKSEMAYADSLTIGNINFTNVFFLILPDEDLTFAGGAYVINGIIGFPVIEDMKEITISEKEIFIPAEPENSEYNNLSLDGLIPIVQTIVNSDTLIFSFDTGARTTMLYHNYFDENKNDIESKYKLEDVQFGGAGGDVKMKGYYLNKMKFQIGSGVADLNKISLLTESIIDNDKFVYGNLGGDFINSFEKMTINFEYMYVDFKNEPAGISPAELKILTGDKWKGNLTYLDYTSLKETVIQAGVKIISSDSDKNMFLFEIEFPKEPQADYIDTLKISNGGSYINSEKVILRKNYSRDSLMFATEFSGMDDDKECVIKHTYFISPHNFIIRKEVKYNGDSVYTKRNEYKFER